MHRTSPISRHIHLIGICGTAMASLAGMLQAQGHRITGSDAAAYPPMSDQLLGMGIAPLQPYSEAHLMPAPDLVVVGNAISRGNPELEYVLDRRIPFCSMAALIHEEFLLGRESLVVAGTHGKTTTTSMLAWIYEVASRGKPASQEVASRGKPASQDVALQGGPGFAARPELAPSFLIGGVAENFGSSYMVRDTRPFLLEGDEYDTAFFDKGPKFLHYFPDAAILTHVEFDHADIYPDLAAVKTAFKRFVNLLPRRGRIIAFDGSANVSECVALAFCSVERYGFLPDSHWRMTDFRPGSTPRWTLLRQGEHFADLELPMPGEHNALNATAAAALAAGQGISAAAIAEALRSFRSVKRRLQVCAELHGVTVIDDFAHHPTAIRETLRALRSAYPGRRLMAVLEPRSNSLRRNVFEADLVSSLSAADHVVLAEVFRSEAIPAAERLEPARVVASLNAQGTPAQLLPDAGTIARLLAPQLRPGDVVAILSNGGFGGIYTSLPAAIEAHALTPAASH